MPTGALNANVKILRGNFNDPEVQLLYLVGMPTDMERIFILVRGEGLGFPGYTVWFYGVIQGQEERKDAKTEMNIELPDLGIKCHIWRRLLRWKDSKAMLNEFFDPFNKAEQNKTLGWASTIFNLAGDTADISERVNLIHKLADGYHLMFLALDLVKTSRGGFTLKQIREMTEEAAERYARDQVKEGRQPEPFKAVNFARHWRYKIVVNNLYRLIVGDEEWAAVKDAYDMWCKRLRNEG